MNRFLPRLFVVVVLAPFAVACGGKILQGTEDPNANASVDAAAPITSANASGWPACPADSSAAPIPSTTDPSIVDMCTRICDHAFSCEKCAWSSCVPSCVEDTAKGECGDKATTWYRCFLDHLDEAQCGAPASCDATYCDYANCGVEPAYQSTCP